MKIAVVAATTGWDLEKQDDQPDWLIDTVYAIIVVDKQLQFKQKKAQQ